MSEEMDRLDTGGIKPADTEQLEAIVRSALDEGRYFSDVYRSVLSAFWRVYQSRSPR